MALDINKIGNYNGKTFLGSDSARPISGHFLRDAFKGALQQGKVDDTKVIVPGSPIAIKNTSTTTEAGTGLNPNVFSITNAADDGSDVAGFSLASPTDIIDNDYPVGVAYPTQIINIAVFGSGVELYLPIATADTQLASGVSLTSKVKWSTDGVTVATDGTISILGPAVDGLKYKADGSEFVECKVIKVRV